MIRNIVGAINDYENDLKNDFIFHFMNLARGSFLAKTLDNLLDFSFKKYRSKKLLEFPINKFINSLTF